MVRMGEVGVREVVGGGEELGCIREKMHPLDQVRRNRLKWPKGRSKNSPPLRDSNAGKVQEIWVVNGETIMLICFLPIGSHQQSRSNYRYCRHTVALMFE